MDDVAESLIAALEFDILDCVHLGMLDAALDVVEGGSRAYFLIAAIKHSAASRLEVPHDFL